MPVIHSGATSASVSNTSGRKAIVKDFVEGVKENRPPMVDGCRQNRLQKLFFKYITGEATGIAELQNANCYYFAVLYCQDTFQEGFSRRNPFRSLEQSFFKNKLAGNYYFVKLEVQSIEYAFGAFKQSCMPLNA